MIYVNDKLIDYNDIKQVEKNPVVKWISKKITEVRRELPMIIEMPKTQGVTHKTTGMVEFPQSRPIVIAETVTIDGANYHVRWSERPKDENRGKETRYYPHRIVKFGAAFGAYNGAMVLTEKDVELAFFVKHVSKQKGVDFVIRDDVAAAQNSIQDAKRKATIDTILPGMPNSIEDDIILIIAESFGIGNAEDIIERHGEENGILIIRDRLYNLVMLKFKSDKTVADDLSRRTKLDGMTRAMSVIYRAINKRVIHIVDVPKEGRFWRLKSGENFAPCQGINQEENLAKYLLKSVDKYDQLKSYFDIEEEKESGDIVIEEEATPEELRLEKLRKLYVEHIGNVPLSYKNKAEWLEKKLVEKDVEIDEE